MGTVMATSTLSVEKFPNFLPLRNQAGRAIALFSDYGSWLAITWGTDCLIEIRDTISGQSHTLDLASPLHRSTSYPDRQEAELLDGRRLQVGFCPDGNILIEVRAAAGEVNQRLAKLTVQSTLPHRVESDGFCARLLVGQDAQIVISLRAINSPKIDVAGMIILNALSPIWSALKIRRRKF